MFRKYICVKQHDPRDCGVACLSTIAKTYGRSESISKIKEQAGTDLAGTNINGILPAAKYMGFTAKAVRGTPEALYTNFPLPAIAHISTDDNTLHYVVIHKISKKKIFTIADPARGIVKLTGEEFVKQWTGTLIVMVPSENFITRKDEESVLRRFFILLKPQKKLLFNIFLASLVYTIMGIFGAFYFKFLMDDIIPNGLINTLNTISIGFIILFVFQLLLGAFRTHLILHLSQKLDIPLILGYYNHVLKLPMNFFGTRKVGEIISRFMDASHIREMISGATLTLMMDTIMVFAGAIILFMQNSLLFGISVICAILYGIIAWIFNKPFRKSNKKIMESNSELTSYLVETLQGIESVKGFNAENEAEYQTEKKFVNVLKETFKAGIIQNTHSTLKGSVELIGGLVIVWVGALEVLNGNLTIGQLLTFNALLGYFLTPIRNLINLQLSLQTAVVSAERLGEILDLEVEEDLSKDQKIYLDRLPNVIQIRDLNFAYGTRALTLKNINMTINRGEKIALVGESGSGKTTLIKLLLKFYEAKEGEILFGNYNIQDIQVQSLRERIGYVPQSVFLFSGSIEENLKLGRDLSKEEVISACKKTSAHNFINKLPHRYQTNLEENGANLSGGQCQQLAITRALLQNPEILIMDEATSNLDTLTEKSIEQLFSTHYRDVTMIFIAHRLSTIKSCDRIYVMDNGYIIEEGTHNELLLQKGKYYDLWKNQISEEIYA